jgi:hypothetical protein
MDLAFVFRQIGVSFHWIVPRHLPYAVTKALADDDHQKYHDYQCGVFDFIIFGDTVPRARALIENNCSSSQIVLQVTQRFDAGMHGDLKREWIELLRWASTNMPNVRVIVNNPYESWYMQHVQNASFLKTNLIRPSGHWPKNALPRVTPPSDVSGKVAVVVQRYIPYLNKILLGNMTDMNITFTKLDHGQYGGAHGLASYRCVVQFPYQVSVMAMYENLAAGVALIVPSKTFYMSIAHSLHKNGVGLHLTDLPVLDRHPDGWDAMEWSNPYFKDALIHFDSWNHLLKAVPLLITNRKCGFT